MEQLAEAGIEFDIEACQRRSKREPACRSKREPMVAMEKGAIGPLLHGYGW